MPNLISNSDRGAKFFLQKNELGQAPKFLGMQIKCVLIYTKWCKWLQKWSFSTPKRPKIDTQNALFFCMINLESFDFLGTSIFDDRGVSSRKNERGGSP